MTIDDTTEILSSIWHRKDHGVFTCPRCGSTLTIVQVEPIDDPDNAYTPYRTIIECTACPFSIETESYTILGSVKEYTPERINIGSWSPSGSRVLSQYKHQLDKDLLDNLKKTGDLVEFLIVNKEVVQVIG
ncbi:MAG: hypothetical protein QXS02_00660 [Candidatus Thermoplasmatota archaeon]